MNRIKKMNTFWASILLVIIAFAVSRCSHGPCNNVPQREEAGASPSPSPSMGDGNTTKVAEKTVVAPPDSILIYKPTGEHQCEQNKGVSLDDMQTQLSSKKITVYDSRTQPDGLMHMALCGAPTGNIHVFTISKKDLKKTLRLGFKVLKTKS